MKNLLEQFLDEIEVCYTQQFADKLYYEHPHRYNMYGLKRMLDVYGVKTIGVRIEDKDLSLLNFPCVLHTHGDFAIGLDCDAASVTDLRHGKKTTVPHDVFRQTWTGNALVVEETTEAVEPDYRKHQQEQWLSKAKTCSIPVMLALAAAIGWASNFPSMNAFTFVCILLSMAGILLCALLMQKQLSGESRYGNRVCSLFHHADCNSILDSPMAKILGISWSEVGLGYFTANILLLTLYPASMGIVAVLNWVAMLYGIWSICYQWRVAKSWCVLCVLAQVIIWMTGAASAALCLTAPVGFSIASSLLSFIVFLTSIIAVHLCASVHASDKERILAVQQHRALKANNAVAKALIEKGEYYETTMEESSSIIFGNPEAKMRVTILSNPHCNPCARMHDEVERLLDSCGETICVQYIFSSFNEQLEDSSRYLISCYDRLNQRTTRQIYSGWYAGEKNNHAKIVRRNDATIHTEQVEMELQKHRDWLGRTGLAATPTLLVNGYELPREYELADLAMVTECAIESRKNILQDINGRITTPFGAE